MQQRDGAAHEHGALLVSRALGLLCATQRRGLSEASLTDLISASDDVLCWRWPYAGAAAHGAHGAARFSAPYRPAGGGVLQYHDPPVRRVPPLVVRRLLDGLEGFVVERGARGGGTTLAFYHRQARMGGGSPGQKYLRA